MVQHLNTISASVKHLKSRGDALLERNIGKVN